jgi:transcriptional regulator GlxA family with amidase domain
MLSWLARRSTPRSLLNFNKQNGFESVSSSDFSGLTFSMTPESFSRNAESMDPDGTVSEYIAKHELFCIDLFDAQAISRLADGLLRVASMESGATCYAELESELIYLLSRAIHTPRASLHRNTLSQRQKAVDRSIEYIRSIQGHVKVSDVYRAAHVSWRTLDRGFQERFGITPKQYIVVNRLNRARRALTAANTDLNVSRIALEQGFWHLGRFSADYKAMFGELPSATLRRGQA